MGLSGATYSGIVTLNLNLGSGNDNLTIASTNASTATNVNTDGGNDSVAVQATSGVTNVNTGTGVNSVTVGSLAPSSGGILDNVQGPLNLTGTGADSLLLDDTGSPGTKNGTLNATTITGLGMGSSGITYGGFSTLTINLGPGSNTFDIAGTAGLPSPVTTTTFINTGGGNDTLNVTGMGGPATVDGAGGTNIANVNIAGNFASSLTLLNFVQTNLTIGGNFSGSIATTGNLTGTLNGDDSGFLSAGTVTSISMPHGHATGTSGQVLQIVQGGVNRQVDALPAVQNASLAGVSFMIFYDGSSASIPQAAIRVTNSGTTRFDLVLACSSTASRFDLSRVDAGGSGVASVRNVAVSGNILTTVTAAEAAYFAPSFSTGGVVLTKDNLVGVSARDDLANGAVSALSIEGVACATLGGTPVSSLNGTLAAGALASGTAIHEGNDVFRVVVGEEAKVELFVDTANDAHLNDVAFNLTDEAIDGNDVSALMNIVSSVSHNQYRVTLVETDFLGNGGSLDTTEPANGIVTSTGSLGDLMLRSGLGLTSITAASVIGNIDLFGGSLTGTFQTTSGELGQVIYNSSNVATGVTYIHANMQAGSKIDSRGNLVSQITTGTIGGVIAAQGNIGAWVFSGTTLSRFGGITATGLSSGADILSLGNILGDINISGTVSGRIGAKGAAMSGLPSTETGILGNVVISTLANGAAVVSGNMIGDATRGTSINLGSFSGFLAAEGTIKFNASSKTNGTTFQSPLAAQDLTSINNIWASAATFDTGGNLLGLNTLTGKLNSLKVTSGHLTGT
jgi:hypothetical protein